MILAQQSSPLSTYGLFILETLIALGVIAACGWAVVRFGAPRFGLKGRNRRMKLLERLVLEPRRAVHLVEVDGETLLIGTSDRSVHLLKTLDSGGGDTDGRASEG